MSVTDNTVSTVVVKEPPTRWIASATCVVFRAYINSESRDYLCSRCHKNKPYTQQRHYQYYIRHYLRIGFHVELEACLECQRPVARESSIRACVECPSRLDNFINYLIDEGETPYDSPGAVYVLIDQYHSAGWNRFTDVSD